MQYSTSQHSEGNCVWTKSRPAPERLFVSTCRKKWVCNCHMSASSNDGDGIKYQEVDKRPIVILPPGEEVNGQLRSVYTTVLALDLGGEQATAGISLHQPRKQNLLIARELHSCHLLSFSHPLSAFTLPTARPHHASQETATKPGWGRRDSESRQKTKEREWKWSQDERRATTS